MKILASLRSLAATAFHHSRLEHEMDEELRMHIANRADDLQRSGVPHTEALRRARLEFGGYQKYKEEIRESFGVNFIESAIQDVRYACRMLRKSPGFTAVAVLTLALGIGANTAIFSVMDATLFRPLPYKNPDRLVVLWGTKPGSRHREMVFSSPNFLDLKDQNRVFASMAAFDSAGLTLSGVDNPEILHVGIVTPSFFKVLDVQPALGRVFSTEEAEAGREHVVILGYALWRQRFASNRAILGKMIRLNGTPYEVVGILPRDFDFSIPDYYGPRDAWVPAVLSRDNTLRKHNYLEVIARLKPGVTLQQAQADVNTVVAGCQTSLEMSPDLAR